eukprot:2196308-Rhodomonas_salina.2
MARRRVESAGARPGAASWGSTSMLGVVERFQAARGSRVCAASSEHGEHWRGSQPSSSHACCAQCMHPGWRQKPVLAVMLERPPALLHVEPVGHGRHQRDTPSTAFVAVPTTGPASSPRGGDGHSSE